MHGAVWLTSSVEEAFEPAHQALMDSVVDLLGLALGALILAFSVVGPGEILLLRERTFYGVNAVLADPSGRYHVFRHGTTVHGAQMLEGPARLEPISYYVAEGPV